MKQPNETMNYIDRWQARRKYENRLAECREALALRLEACLALQKDIADIPAPWESRKKAKELERLSKTLTKALRELRDCARQAPRDMRDAEAEYIEMLLKEGELWW